MFRVRAYSLSPRSLRTLLNGVFVNSTLFSIDERVTPHLCSVASATSIVAAPVVAPLGMKPMPASVAARRSAAAGADRRTGRPARPTTATKAAAKGSNGRPAGGKATRRHAAARRPNATPAKRTRRTRHGLASLPP